MHIPNPANLFFKYGDNYYRNKTIVEFKEDFLKTRSFSGHDNFENRAWQYGEFMWYNNQNDFYVFSPSTETHRIRGCGMFTIPGNQLMSVIKRIVMPHQVIITYIQPKKDWEIPGMILIWFGYIIALGISMIFKDFGILWFIISFIFFWIRHEIKKQ